MSASLNKPAEQDRCALLNMKSPFVGLCSSPVAISNQKRLLAASVGGMITALVVCPFDVVKTRLQVQVSTTLYKNTADAFIKIFRNEGPSTLWRGLAPSLLMTVPSNAIYFYAYENLKHTFQQNDMHSSVVPILAGGTARAVAATVTSPLELVRTNLQGVSSSQGQLGVLHMLRKTMASRNAGWRGMFVGLGPTLMRDIPFSAIYWSVYEAMKKRLITYGLEINGSSVPLAALSFVSGAAAGTVAAIFTNPIDVIKTRMQINSQLSSSSDSGPRLRYPRLVFNHDSHTYEITSREGTAAKSFGRANSTLNIFRNIVREEGWSGFTKGLLPRTAKVAPACAIMISTYELIKGAS